MLASVRAFSFCRCRSVPADDRFPPDATVEFVFSCGPEPTKGDARKGVRVRMCANGYPCICVCVCVDIV